MPAVGGRWLSLRGGGGGVVERLHSTVMNVVTNTATASPLNYGANSHSITFVGSHALIEVT